MKLITEEQVRSILTVRKCVEVLRHALKLDYINIPRYRLKSPNALLHVMSASIPELKVMGLKSYGTTRTRASFAVLLFEEPSGQLLAMIEADALGQIRTGAASGLATDLLASKDAAVGAVIGTGFQAETQLLAIDAVRKFQEIRIYSRRSDARAEFIAKMQSQVGSLLVNANSAQEAVTNADVICTITSSKDPVVEGKWIKKGVHINAAGSNSTSRREIDEETIHRAGFICTDDAEQAKVEAGDLTAVLTDWSGVHELKDVVRGKCGRTAADEITLFKSNGVAVEDIAAAEFVYSRL